MSEKTTDGKSVPSNVLLDCCACCGMKPSFVRQPTGDGGWAVECDCGRRSAWWLTTASAMLDWQRMVKQLTGWNIKPTHFAHQSNIGVKGANGGPAK